MKRYDLPNGYYCVERINTDNLNKVLIPKKTKDCSPEQELTIEITKDKDFYEMFLKVTKTSFKTVCLALLTVPELNSFRHFPHMMKWVSIVDKTLFVGILTSFMFLSLGEKDKFWKWLNTFITIYIDIQYVAVILNTIRLLAEKGVLQKIITRIVLLLC